MRQLALGVAILALGSCAREDAPDVIDPGETEAEKISAYVAALDDLSAAAPRVDQGDTGAPARDGDYSCTTTNVSETRQYDKLVALSANSESLWPGAIVAGASVYDGLFTQLVFDRQPLSVSVSLENLAGGKSTIMPRPSLSTFRDAVGDILSSNVTGATPANIHSEVEQVHSEQQLTLALGASVSTVGVKVNASFHWDQRDVMSRYVVKYTQAYYTVDVDQSPSAGAFFAPGVTLDDVRAKVGPGNPPVYVSSITYGRMVLFTFESKYSSEELGAALDFAYRGGVEVTGNTSVRYRDVISSSKVTAYILGGSGGVAAQSIDSYDALMAFIKSGGNYSKESPGAPIAYKLAYLSDNSPARLSFTTDYAVKECVRVSQKIKVTLSSIKVESAGGDAGSDLELYGTISAAARATDTPSVLFTRDEAHAMRIAEGESFPQTGGLGELLLDVVPSEASVITLRLHLWDDDGVANDDIGNETVVAPFAGGWRKELPVYLTGSNSRVLVTLRLDPI